MRIQHNIMAMSAYRNYTNNVSAMKANLEKLSSGYKINRAGDDAAGLAISEKMRAQITGLETAQKNAKDGISLVQTAEGALTEVHDMLNRMVELATQSANGTYDNDTDRAQLQKEMDQLRDEINRIADSSNFNGIQLLDGSMDASPSYSMTDISGTGQTSGAFTIVADGQLGNDAQAGIFTYDLSQFNLTVTVDDDGTVSAQSADGTEVAVSGGGTPVYAAGNDGVARPLDDGIMVTSTSTSTSTSQAGGTTDSGDNDDGDGDDTSSSVGVSFTFGNTTVTLDLAKLGIDVTKAGTYTLTGSDIVGELADKLQAAFGSSTSSSGNVSGGDDTSNDNTVTTTTESQEAESLEEGIVAYEGNTGGGGWSTDSKLAGAGLTFSSSGTTLTVTMNSAPSQVWDGDIDMTLRLSNGTTGNGGEQFAPTVVQEPIDSTKSRQYAQATIDLSQMTMKDGATIQLGNTTYTFAIGADSKFKDVENVIDLTDFTVASFTSTAVVGTNGANSVTASDAALTAASNRFSQVAQNNDTFLVGSTTQGVISLTEREGAVDYKVNNLAGTDGLGTKGTNDNGTPPNGTSTASTQDATVNDWKGLVKFGTAVESANSALTLQIGDTAASYNQLKVNIKDCHTDSLGIADISIADQDGAQAAIDAIKNAINYVSDVRGTLGATQNRLDHTINNLSVMTENIQDAESTIRDVDVAEEMMAYTKNNILIQASQAMLAQANQVPQGVLQLLQ